MSELNEKVLSELKKLDGYMAERRDMLTELVTAARVVVFEDHSPRILSRLDRAAEAFSEEVPWENEPEHIVRCMFCGQVDEQGWHDNQKCPATRESGVGGISE